MLRRGSWKYCAYVGYPPQLFDLENDLWEVENRAEDSPDKLREMDSLLRSIVDYEAVDAKVKEYDRQAFGQWRAEQKKAGTYTSTMALIHSGWSDIPEEDIVPWSDEDEEKIQNWLGGDGR